MAELTRRIGALGVPVLLYADSAGGLRPHDFRIGGLEGLAKRLASRELNPAAGPRFPHPSAGATLLGVRPPLLAYNVDLQTDSLELAKSIAARIRERGGGFPGVRALGLPLASAGLVQVSMNIEHPARTSLADVVEAIRGAAAEEGVEVRRGELIGLMPAACAAEAAGRYLQLEGFDEGSLLEVALGRAGL